MWKINRLQKAKENGVIKYVQKSLFLLFIALFVSCSTPEQAANESPPYGDFPLRQYWSYQADGNIVALTADDTSIVAATDSKILAVSGVDGRQLWEIEFNTGDPITSSLLVKAGVVIGMNDEEMIALEAQSGKKLWSQNLQFEERGEPKLDAISENYFVVERTSYWIIEVYDKSTGAFLWACPGTRGGSGIFIDESHHIFVVIGDQPRVYQLETGELLLEKSLHSSEYGAFEYPVVYYYEYGRKDKPSVLTALDIETGQELWQVRKGYRINRVSLHNDLLVLGSDIGIHAFDRQGSLVWEVSTHEAILDAPVKIQDYIVVMASPGVRAYTVDGQLAGSLYLAGPESPTLEDVLSGSSQTNISTSNGLLIIHFRNRLYSYGT